MTEFARAKRALDVIKKEGDLFDAILQAKNAKPTSNGLIRANVLLFSRIMYLGFIVKDKIASYFSPIKKVYDAQEEIRKILGFNVDVIKEKYSGSWQWQAVLNIKRSVAILYEDNKIGPDEYIANLKKLLTFCKLQGIKTIYLNLDDVNGLFPELNLDDILAQYRSDILNSENLPYDGNDTFLDLDCSQLEGLINSCFNYRLNYRFVLNIAERIKNLSIKNAISKYMEDKDLTYLMNVVSSRLSLSLNSNNSYKTRNLGKCYDNITIKGEFLYIVSYSNDGQRKETNIMSLYDYLGYQNYEDLLKSLSKPNDEEEISLLAILYLYLYKEQNTDILSEENNTTYFDKIYQGYLEEKKNGTNKKQRFKEKLDKNSHNLLSFMWAMYFTAAIVGASWVGLVGLDFMLGEDSNLASAFFQGVLETYKKSWELEREVLKIPYETGADIVKGFSSLIGDAFGLENNDDKIVANLTYCDTYAMPSYFACEYGKSSSYKKGNISYDLVQPYLEKDDFYDGIKENLIIDVKFSRKELKDMIKDGYLRVPVAVCPVGEFDYLLTEIEIHDRENPSNSFIINSTSIARKLTDDEIKALKKMKEPAIYYYYAYGYCFFYNLNPFVSKLPEKGKYLTTDSYEMREIITANLGLDPQVDNYFIAKAIRNKIYSETPFKDAGLSSKIRKMNEKEFIDCVSSLDSLVCNLAATLMVECDDSYIYVTGFYSDDPEITYGEAHAWVMDRMGNLVDATPAHRVDEEKKDSSKSLANWAKAMNVTLPVLLLILSLIIFKKYGRKVVFVIKEKSLLDLFTNGQMAEAYSLINEVRYYGISLPVQRDYEQTLNMVADDFEGYTKEELQEILQDLKAMHNPNKDFAIKVIKRVPFIKENEEALKRKLNKRKDK